MKKIAMVFPGQGSQFLGMLSASAENLIIRETFAEASTVLGYDLWELAQKGPEEKLNQTEYTQPVLLTASIAAWRNWQQQARPIPVFMAGHSLGEYSALVAAQALDFKDALQLVASRGRYMQEAAPEGVGAMAVIVGLNNQEISKLCSLVKEKNEVLSPANFNSIGQVVIAGHSTAIERAIILAQAKGAKLAKRIPISVPSHCELMQTAAKRLAADLSKVTVNSPKIPVIHNYDVSLHHDPESIRQALIQQLILPVRWVETIQFMEKHQVEFIVECGPGKVLTGLNKRISSIIITQPVAELAGH